MNPDEHRFSIERRLREEAQRLASIRKVSMPREELERRRRLCDRRIAYAACGGVLAASLVCLAASVVFWTSAGSRLTAVSPSDQAAKTETPIEAGNAAIGKKQPALPASAVPIVVTRRLNDREEVIAVGVYVPPEKEPLEFDKLSPAHREAVERLIGAKRSPVLREPI